MKNLIINTTFKRAAYSSLEAGRPQKAIFVFSTPFALLRRAEARLSLKNLYYSTGKGRLEGIDLEKIYLDADIQKLDILKENKGKSGIYL